MAINRYTYPYEILFRLTQSGGVQGCHRKDLEIVKDDETGEIYSTKETDPMAIAGADMDAVLGTLNTALLANVAEVEQQTNSLTAQLGAAQTALQQAEQDRDDLVSQLQQANEQIQLLNDQLSALSSQQQQSELPNAGTE
jgi:hypothetical protein